MKVISITQPTGEEISGEMMRRIMSLFDEYQSKENSKHTFRAMNENARRGFFNGSMAPFGYRSEEVETQGNKGKEASLFWMNGKSALCETSSICIRMAMVDSR